MGLVCFIEHESRSQHHLRRSNKTLRHREQRGAVEDHVEVWLPDRFVKRVRQFHDGILARVRDDGNASDPSQVSNTVKQAASLPLCCSVWCSRRC